MTRDTFAPFPKTDWTRIREIGELTAERRRELLGELVSAYWKPLYAFFRAKGKTRADAEDAVQDFLVKVVNDEKLSNVDAEQGRFRDWLVVCARNFMLDSYRKQNAKKRSPDGAITSLDAMKARDGIPFEPAAGESPETAFANAWKRDLLERGLNAVRQECQHTHRENDYHVFVEYYVFPATPQPTWQDLADKYRLPTWKHAARKADWVKAKFRHSIRAEIRRCVTDDNDVDDELRAIMSQ